MDRESEDVQIKSIKVCGLDLRNLRWSFSSKVNEVVFSFVYFTLDAFHCTQRFTSLSEPPVRLGLHIVVLGKFWWGFTNPIAVTINTG